MRQITAKVNKAESIECRVLLKNKKTGKFWKHPKPPVDDPMYEETISLSNGKVYLFCDSPSQSSIWPEDISDEWDVYIVPPKGELVYESK